MLRKQPPLKAPPSIFRIKFSVHPRMDRSYWNYSHLPWVWFQPETDSQWWQNVYYESGWGRCLTIASIKLHPDAHSAKCDQNSQRNNEQRSQWLHSIVTGLQASRMAKMDQDELVYVTLRSSILLSKRSNRSEQIIESQGKGKDGQREFSSGILTV